MTQEVKAAEEPAFNVAVQLPTGTKLEDVEKKGELAGIKPQVLRTVVDALRAVPHVQIGKAVSRARADAAKALYEQAGLKIVITPVLSLEAQLANEHVACPACRQRVILTESRQCPNCSVYVDKFTGEYHALLRKAELDRAAYRRELEDEFEKKLDAAVYERLKKQGVFKGSAGAARGVALLAFVCVAFIGGRATLAGWNPDALLSMGPRDMSRQLLESAWPSQPRGSSVPVGQAVAAVATGSDGGDADADDPLVRQANGKGAGGKGISIEQAVAASRVLARSVGNTTADRAIDGAPPATDDGASKTVAASEPVPPSVKFSLGLDLARQLAEMGQVGRATQIATALGSRAASAPELTAQSQATSIEIRAWSLGAMDPARARATADQLLQEAQKLGDVPTRVIALTQAAVALAHQPQLPRDAARAFIARAGESIPEISAPERRDQVVAIWAAGMGSVMLNESLVAARAGRWSVVREDTASLVAMTQKAPPPAQSRLLAMISQMQSMQGDLAGAARSLDSALDLMGRDSNLANRASTLRAIATGVGSMNEKISAAGDVLQAQAQAAGGDSAARAQALVQLSLMNAENGSRSKAEETALAARKVAGLAPADALDIEAQLIVRSDMVGARALQGVGMYGEAESLVRRVGGYLL